MLGTTAESPTLTPVRQATSTDSHTDLSTDSPSVSAVALKLPQIWRQDPFAWFAYAETNFNLHGITRSRTKYNHLVSALPYEVIAEVRDILCSTEVEDPYGLMKQAIIDRTAISERERFRQLLSREGLGDGKPSQLLRHMQSLLQHDSKNFDNRLLRELFTQKLPVAIQRVLATMPTSTALETLASVADRVMDVDENCINAVQTSSHSNPQILDLEKKVSDLSDQVSKLLAIVQKNEDRSCSPSRDRQRRVQHCSPQRQNNSTASGQQCYYHKSFGTAARKCVSPCNYKGKREPRVMTTTTARKRRVLRLPDRHTNLNFLIETGADVSILPASTTDRSKPPTSHLYSANGSSIPVFREKSLTLDFGLRRTFRWVVLIANVKQPILGADFLHHFNLLVDLKKRVLVDGTTNLKTTGDPELKRVSTVYNR
ncbi:uncharacterized protein LOC108676784 [Hyalella azteca]|uniref:Uncharacterized protein LOC108676784 n=1 Tax=Hyalella azteca TaxID=294128 RepID=A0A8B7P373_HYAAZ|nr:uncharacterized protein LOC108676784 [Hyalella azteca]